MVVWLNMGKFEIKQKIDDSIYHLYNLVTELQFALNTKAKKILENNKKYLNAHKDGRCFILGTGPSLGDLTENQIQQLKKENTFALNSLYKSKIGRAIFPSYYALMDNNYWEDAAHKKYLLEIAEQYSKKPPVFITDIRAFDIFDNMQNIEKTIYLYAKKYPVGSIDVELHKNTYGLMNVVSVCIASAIYMGFKEIYLLGCDYNAFCNFGRGHCYDDREELKEVSYNLAFYLKYYHITTEFHYLIAKFAKENDIRIVNLTSVSLLDAYPRAPVSSVLN